MVCDEALRGLAPCCVSGLTKPSQRLQQLPFVIMEGKAPTAVRA